MQLFELIRNTLPSPPSFSFIKQGQSLTRLALFLVILKKIDSLSLSNFIFVITLKITGPCLKRYINRCTSKYRHLPFVTLLGTITIYTSAFLIAKIICYLAGTILGIKTFFIVMTSYQIAAFVARLVFQQLKKSMEKFKQLSI